ncbi:glycosyltransferase family 2 protein [Limibaculum sp. M0105]|uniref:Glycosyltransferase family 2 protein n=1 Tax=Thermohalobaculum xanthum TaxID=2753746 RepID=A0A8J7SC01_9RHOB|nr:glycosyltransferase family 2 protein [Thermohalobaculum xanthum]MBK0399212.1 glycosyltransferase family 2 protein [Thermohalobaculum xanthum]
MARVSIGIPVYNAAAMLEESLEGLRAQTFGDWEALISDNASEDDTPRIIEKVCAREPRLRSVRQTENIGPTENFRFVLRETNAPYFMWRSYDDLCSDDYVERLIRRLDEAPGAMLAAPHVETLRLGSGKRRPRPVASLERGSPHPATVLRKSQAGWIYGLWRREAVIPSFERAVTALDPDLWAWDHLAMFPAICRGAVVFDDAARLTLRLSDRPYKSDWSPGDRDRLRRLASAYRRECRAEMDRSGLAGWERLRMELAVLRQINRRVARFSRLV